MHKIIPCLAAAAAGLLSLTTPAQASQAAELVCPKGNSGFVLWPVSTDPYLVDNAVDERGNDDGFACARPAEVVTDEEGNPFQLYIFIDNRVPSTD